MQQEQQGNGLIGGGIGLGLGAVAGHYAATPLADFLPYEAFGNGKQYVDFMTQLDRKYEGIGRPNYTNAEERIKDELYGDSLYKYGQRHKAISLLSRIGLPITTSLIGSTLTD